MRSFLLVELNHILRTIEESDEGHDLLEYKDRCEAVEEELPANAEGSPDDSLLDASHEERQQHALVEHIRAHKPHLVEKTDEEEGVRNDVVEAQDPRTLAVNRLMALAHEGCAMLTNANKPHLNIWIQWLTSSRISRRMMGYLYSG